MKKLILSALVFGGILWIASCGGEQKNASEEPQNTNTTETTTAVEPEIIDEEEQTFILPSPLQITSIMKRAGLIYQDGLTADPALISQFSTRYEQTLAFGIYSADLAYCVLNQKTQEGLQYMKAVRQMADNLGITTLFNDENLIKTFERNLNNDDSLLYVIASVQEKLDEYLEENQKEYMHVLIFAGAWTEGMYLGAQSSQLKEGKVAQKLVEQMVILDNLIRGLQAYPQQNEEIKSLIADLKDIENTFESFQALNGKKIEEVELDQIRLSENDIKTLSEKITALRNKLLNTK